jgi:hypothetical protein
MEEAARALLPPVFIPFDSVKLNGSNVLLLERGSE